MASHFSILIAGAGISGLTTAIEVAAHGSGETTLIERRSRGDASGFGLNISPHAVELLQRRGILTDGRSDHVEGNLLHLISKSGRELACIQRQRRNGYPHIMIHRAELIRALDARLKQVAKSGSVLYGAELREVLRYRRPVAKVRRGSREHQIAADCIAVATGSTSSFRRQINALSPIRQREVMHLWRGIAHLDGRRLGDDMFVFGDDVSRVVMYPVRHTRFGTHVNWVAALPGDAKFRAMQRSSTSVVKAFLTEFFSGWAIQPVGMRELMAASRTIRAETLVDHTPIQAWSRGDVVLIGDAAHPMLPMGSSGAGQAIADGIMLASSLRDVPPGKTEVAFRNYHRQRRDPVNKLVELNRSMGPEQILTDYHLRTGGRGLVEDCFTAAELQHYGSEYQAALEKSFANIASEGSAHAG